MVTTNFVNCGFVCPTKAVKEFLWWAYRTDASHFLNRTFLTARLERVAIFLLYFWKATLYKGRPKVLRLGQFFRSVFSVFEQNSVLSFSSLISLHFFLFFGVWFLILCQEKKNLPRKISEAEYFTQSFKPTYNAKAGSLFKKLSVWRNSHQLCFPNILKGHKIFRR